MDTSGVGYVKKLGQGSAKVATGLDNSNFSCACSRAFFGAFYTIS